MIQDIMDFLSQADPEVGASIQKEFDREQHNIELIASENIVSKAVLLAMGTCLTNKYAEGYPGKRYYGGCYAVDVTEELARQRACQLFDCAHANVQPHSGANANLAAFFALLQPGDTVLSMNLAHGGHLSHGSPVNISGKYFRIVPYGVSDDTETIDYEQVMAIAKECRPKLILAGASAYPRTLDFAKFREIADAVGARLMVDMAHIAGLVAAGVHPSPIPYADVVTTTTHKTLRGPRGGMILCNDDDLYKKINSAVFPGTQGGPLEHIIAAKAVCLGEALKPEFRAYGRQRYPGRHSRRHYPGLPGAGDGGDRPVDGLHGKRGLCGPCGAGPCGSGGAVQAVPALSGVNEQGPESAGSPGLLQLCRREFVPLSVQLQAGYAVRVQQPGRQQGQVAERCSLLRRLHEFYVDGMGASLDPLGQSILHLQGPAVSKIKCQHLLCEKVLLPGDSGLGLFQP